MASFPLDWSKGLLIAQEKVSFCVGRSLLFAKQNTLSYPLSKNRFIYVSNPLLFNFCPHKVHNRFLCCDKLKPVVNEKINTDTHLVTEKRNNEPPRKFSLRLRPRIWLLSRKLKRASIKSLLDGIGTFLRKNAKKLTLSTCVFVALCLCLPPRKFSLRLRPRIWLLSRKLKRASIKSLLDGTGTFLQKNAKKLTLSTCVFVVLCLCFCFLKIIATPTPKIVPYAHLISSLHSGNVANVMFEEGTEYIYYDTRSWIKKNTQFEADGFDIEPRKYVAQDTQEGECVFMESTKTRNSCLSWEFRTRKIDQDVGYLLSLMREMGTSYGSAPQSVLITLRSMLIMMLVLWIPLTPLVWLLHCQISVGNSPAKTKKSSKTLVCFEDVEGVDTAKVELMEIVSCLQGAINYSKLGAKLPRGVLLMGPPGSGKTLLARAVAGESRVPFFSVSASEFVELFVGRGAARVRELFDVARKNSPSIVFIDELDAVGGIRGRSFNDERDQTLNQLLTEMDGFGSDINVVVIAATNRPDALDPALCRPGRFSRKVYVGEPDEDGRKRILAIHFRAVPLEEDIELICSLVSSLTQGLVGADLANIVNEAALLAARRGADCVSREDIMEAVERAKFGINGRQTGPSAISKKIGKLFPWMPSLNNNDGMQGPLGFQTLS
ncbi:putative inactive ATP-dependent zinc metalloprotease FTSHI 3, chloroplastic [Orobanche minor]